MKDRKRLAHTDWSDDVREGINAFLDRSEGSEREYAVFDFDNTITIFDMEDQMMEYQIDVMAFAIPPADFGWIMCADAENCSKAFKEAAADAGKAYQKLWEDYGGFCSFGLNEFKREIIHNDPFWIEFHVKMLRMFKLAYSELKPETADRWMMHRFYGMSTDEIYRLSLDTINNNKDVKTYKRIWQSPWKIASSAGCITEDWIYGISVTDNIGELMSCLKDNGIDVWVCSASNVDAVRGGIDAFGLHDVVTGVLGMTPKTDAEGRCLTEYDYESGRGYYCLSDGVWKQMERPEAAVTCEEGKVTAIRNAIAPEYNGRGPVAGFMDSEGDFAFCTTFDSIRLLLCINRANRRPEDGGSIIARAALWQKAEKNKAKSSKEDADGKVYLLQGRDEYLRKLINSNKTLLFGEKEAVLFTDKRNMDLHEKELREAASAEDIILSRKGQN